MALDLSHNYEHGPVDAWWLAVRLAEQCENLRDIAWDDDRARLTVDAANYEWPRGLEVTVDGRRFRLHVTAEEMME